MVISARVSRCAAIALAGFTALSLAGCGSSGPSSSSSSTRVSASPTQGAAGKDKQFGLVGSVSGGTVTLTAANGPATVDVTPSTRVIEVALVQLTDVTAGDCALVRPTRDSSAQPIVTAATMLVGVAENGQCGGQGRWRGVSGTVASVNGDSVVLTTSDNNQTTVTVTPNTRYAKRSKTDTSAIAAGKCLAAQGTKDGNGDLQATDVYLRPSQNGRCAAGRRQGG